MEILSLSLCVVTCCLNFLYMYLLNKVYVLINSLKPRAFLNKVTLQLRGCAFTLKFCGRKKARLFFQSGQLAC